MTGFAGVFAAHPLERSAAGRLLTDMARDITYNSSDLTDCWMDEHLGVTRVHHGVLNPESQPIFNEDGSLCIIMDGEVFDYADEKRRLERRGHRFHYGENDAEYCLHLYEEHGTAAFGLLNGSFALMIYDRLQEQLLLVSDRLSSYGLFHAKCQRDLAFATQLRPLLRWDRLPRRLNIEAVYQFFALRRVLADGTYYQDVKVLAPASILCFQNGAVRVGVYWKPEFGDHTRSAAEYAERLAHSLKLAVGTRTAGSQRLGILLSGGMDSRSVLACCERPLTAFTLADFENREVRIARSVASAAGSRHVFLKRSQNHYADGVDEAVDIGDGMLRADHAHVLGLLDEMRPHCDIVLDAFGFDAKFKGAYLIHRSRSILGRTFHTPELAKLSDLDTIESWRRVRYNYLPAEVRELFHPRYSLALEEAALAAIRDLAHSGPEADPQDLIGYVLASAFLSHSPYLMVLATRAHIPQRSIVSDNDLLDVSLSLSAHLRARGRLFKRTLKRLSPRMAAIQDANTRLRADLPVWPEFLIVSCRIALEDLEVVRRPKLAHPAYTQRSWPDMAELIRHNEKLRTMIQETIRDPRCIDPGLFRAEAAEVFFRQHLARKADHTKVLLGLLTFGRWHRRYGPD